MAGARASTVGRLDSGRRALTTLKAKLTGFLVERTEDLVKRKRDELEEQRARRHANLEVANAAELLAQAAQALGLPLKASAREIVLEASKIKYLSGNAFFSS
jgi:hypothetical protein